MPKVIVTTGSGDVVEAFDVTEYDSEWHVSLLEEIAEAIHAAEYKEADSWMDVWTGAK
jgi:hypothetical protein